MNEFENKPIEYARFKKKSNDKIVTDERGKYEVKRKTTTKGYDNLLSKWVDVDVSFTFHTMESVGCYKELIQTFYLKRTALGNDLKEISKWFKVRKKVSVVNKNNNIFLTEADGRIFQSDLTMTAPMNLNYVPEGIKIENLDETALAKLELQNLERQLKDEKCYFKPLCVNELQNGEYRLIVQ